MRLVFIDISRDNVDKLIQLIKIVDKNIQWRLTHDLAKPTDLEDYHMRDAELARQQAEQQQTFYCLFYPLGIYCAFGASNIHHAYNKAAKHWGFVAPTVSVPMSQRNKMICVKDIPPNASQWQCIKQTLMTKLVKAWREEQQ